MYIIKNVVGIDIPDAKTRIIRVFDKDKYNRLFSDNAIWFCNIDTLIKRCDNLERTIPQGFYERMSISDAAHYRTVNELKDKLYKSYISCWSQTECEQLWNTYDPAHEGFAIVTTCGQVMSEIGNDRFLCCKAKYINVAASNDVKTIGWASINDEKMPAPVSVRIKEQYKDGKYIDDNEIRFIGFDCQNSDGQNIPVNLSKIINGAIINPYASPCVRQALEAYLEDKGISLMQSECN